MPMAGLFPKAAMAVLAALVLAACVPALGPAFGPAKKPAGPNPVTGGEIEVTVLDDLTAAGAEAPAGSSGAAALPAGTPAALAPPPGAVKPRPRPSAMAAPAAEGEAAAEGKPVIPPAPEAAEAVPEVEKSAAQVACEKKKGVWAKAGDGARACVTYTRDGGKSCDSGKDCDGDCLARSRSCAPYKPLFGCNEILDDGGRRTTLCLD
ncbi:hypothetical protein LHP98_09480 [Rhodobacter sp. Har01]|uniref:hypothetical protein n=1 Tax=Rhodobacter sp. Har01 TaxID=2883999 RepID=UPI001D07E75D|nr:hypothetical protein [Rhodobacter sp. Har01]MCB6178359.1 hypothetical protein [Rhodobacter sp. Har01]